MTGQAPEVGKAATWKNFADSLGETRWTNTAESGRLEEAKWQRAQDPISEQRETLSPPVAPSPRELPASWLPPQRVPGFTGICPANAGSSMKAETQHPHPVPLDWPQRLLREHLIETQATSREKTKPSTCAYWAVRGCQTMSYGPQASPRRTGDHQHPGKTGHWGGLGVGHLRAGCHLMVEIG